MRVDFKRTKETRRARLLKFSVFINHVNAWRKMMIAHTPFSIIIKIFYNIYYSKIINI